jgi:prepilin-type N-terminal cleavage/methylation domain-containing protein/prepilin-type processing-associated H-X9-DG protein
MMKCPAISIRRSPSAFTLVELLVVISIIAMLTAVLLPSLSAAKEQAKQIVCSSNIHQLFLANSGYAVENDGFYVIAAEDMWGRNLHRWHGVRTNINTPFDPLKSPLVAYLADGKVKKCPSFVRYLEEAGQNGGGFEAGCGGYGYNDEYIGGRSDLYGMGEGSKHSARDVDVQRPAETVMFTDCAFRQGASGSTGVFIEYSFAHPPYWLHYLQFMGPSASDEELAENADFFGGRPNPSIHFRHRGFTNACWADGHVTKETMDLSAPYITHAVMNDKETAQNALGWFGPANNSLFDLQ